MQEQYWSCGGDNGITQGYYEDGEFHDGDYSYIPDIEVHWMEKNTLFVE